MDQLNAFHKLVAFSFDFDKAFDDASEWLEENPLKK